MNELQDKMENVRDGLDVLIDSVEDKVCAVLKEKEPVNAYAAMLWRTAQDIHVLLRVMSHYLADLDEQQGSIVGMLSVMQGGAE